MIEELKLYILWSIKLKPLVSGTNIIPVYEHFVQLEFV